MKITHTEFEGLIIIEPDVFHDARGFFMEAFNEYTLKKHGIDMHFVQDNQSYSKKGVIRGLHFQKPPYAQTKLVRVLSGTILDVAVDLRKGQPTFKKVYSVELSSRSSRQLLIPKGFAHGFSVLSEEADVLYKSDGFYHPEAEGGIFYKDPELGINWIVPDSEAIVSVKDLSLPLCNALIANF
jgi:dTDP-4-dehydrorhamnose 3,5-epimerase